jgi:GT2 family glycosyltransferase
MSNHTPGDNVRPDLSVVLVCWNNKEYLEGCLDSIYSAGLHSAFEILVVDNGSTDGSQSMLKERYPDVILIENGENVGLGRASNQGVQASIGRFALLLNNDTIVSGEAINAMVRYMEENEDAGAVGGKLLNADGSFQGGFGNFSTLREEFLITSRIGELLSDGYPSHRDAADTRPVDWLSSACLLVRRKAFDEVGGLDEEYFIYGDEVDLQYRLKKAGWTVYYIPNAETLHYGGRSMDRWRRRKMVYRGKLLFYRKNYGRAREATLRLLFLVVSLGKLVVWGPALAVPKLSRRARRELNSNGDVLGLCMRLS